MTTILSADGLIEIPEIFRKEDALQAGQTCDIERLGHGDYRVRITEPPSASQTKERIIDLLLRCPVKGFYTPTDRAETTDDLPTLNFVPVSLWVSWTP